jgi:hypothetical protein
MSVFRENKYQKRYGFYPDPDSMGRLKPCRWDNLGMDRKSDFIGYYVSMLNGYTQTYESSLNKQVYRMRQKMKQSSEDEWDSSKDGRNVQTHYEKLWMYHCISIGVNPDYILTNIRPR